MATVSTSVNIKDVTYASAEDITITSGAVLTIDAQDASDVAKLATQPGSFICITSGKLRILNNSTTTPIVLTLSSLAKDFRFEKNGIMETRGASIELGTGTGLTQSFSFSGDLASIPYPSYVEIETASGSNLFLPWVIIPTAGYTVVQAQTEFSGNVDGRVLFWNGTTRTLSSGNGTNGQVIPSGARVRIPNIYLHSATNSTTPSSRTLLDFSTTGTMDFEWTACSNALLYSMSGHGNVTLKQVGFVTGWACSNTNADIIFDGVSISPDTEQTTVVGLFYLSACFGDISIRRVSCLTGGLVTGAKNTWSQLMSIVGDIEYLWIARKNGSTTGSDESFAITTAFKKDGSPLFINGLTCIGNRVEFTNFANCTIKDFKQGFAHGTITYTSTAVAINFANCQNIIISGWTEASPTMGYQALISADGQTSNIKIYDAYVNGNNGTLGFITSGNGSGVEFYNSTIYNARTGTIMIDSPTTFLQSDNMLKNCRLTLSSGTASTDIGKGFIFNLSPATIGTVTPTLTGADSYAFGNFCDLGLTPTTGHIAVGGFGAYDGITLTGTAVFDQAGAIELPAIGDSFEVESSFAMVGITAFQNANPIYSYTQSSVASSDVTTAPTGVDFEFRVRTTTGTYGSYLALTGANLSTAISGLTGYDSDLGLYMQIRVTATTADSTRLISQVCFTTTIDSTYSYPNASINLQGTATTDVTKVYRLSDDALLYTFTGSGAHDFSVGSNFSTECYLVRESSTGRILMTTYPKTLSIGYSDNGTCNLFYGDEVQLAESSEVSDIKTLVNTYLDTTISSRASTTDLQIVNENVIKASKLIPANQTI